MLWLTISLANHAGFLLHQLLCKAPRIAEDSAIFSGIVLTLTMRHELIYNQGRSDPCALAHSASDSALDES